MPSTSREVQIAPGPTPTSRPEMPVSISSFAAPKVTVLPTTTGTRMFAHSSSKMRPRRLREMWRAVVTVDCTTNTSAPASTAMGASFFVLAGVQETAQVTPPSLIARMRRPMSSSRMGAAYSFWITAADSPCSAWTISAIAALVSS